MPSQRSLHVDKLLTNVSVQYKNAEYVADRVFPFVPVEKESDLFRVYQRNFRLPETRRANNAEAREHSFDISTSSYILKRHALKDYISDDDAMNYDMGSLRSDTVEELTDKILLRLESDVAGMFTSTSWSLNTSLSAAQQWSGDTVTSNPIPLFDTAATSVLRNSGFMPNIGIMPYESMIAAKNHQSVLERLKYTTAESNDRLLAALFNLPELLVPKASIDTSQKGQAESISALWGDNCFVGYRAPNPSPRRPSAGYIFRRAKSYVKRYRVEERESEAIEAQMQFDAKVVASLAGYLLKDSLA